MGELQSIELFTGAGGLALATHGAGFKHASLYEWNQDACSTLRFNAAKNSISDIDEWNIVQGDVRDVSFTKHGGIDLVAGGPPCQPFSIGGKHRGSTDNRDMIPQFIRAIRETMPRAFIMENVRGLTREAFANYFSYALLQLTYPTITRRVNEDWMSHLSRLEDLKTKGAKEEGGYNVVFRILNSANFGVPQIRERVFVVGFRNDLSHGWHFPDPTHSREALVRDQTVTGDYWETHRISAPDINTSRPLVESSLKPWRTIRDAISGLPEPTLTECAKFRNHRLQLGARTYAGHTGSPLDWPSKTLKAGAHGVPGGENMILFPDGSVRYLSVREAARIQTFPDDWTFQGAWSEAMRQLGNAVPVDLAKIVAISVARELSK
jgi:DNA (cytosine-5)-methyltransferase 1